MNFWQKSAIINKKEEGEKMVDNRVVSPVSSFNFKSGDISGTAAKTSEETYSQGTEYFAQDMQEEEMQENQTPKIPENSSENAEK